MIFLGGFFRLPFPLFSSQSISLAEEKELHSSRAVMIVTKPQKGIIDKIHHK